MAITVSKKSGAVHMQVIIDEMRCDLERTYFDVLKM